MTTRDLSTLDLAELTPIAAEQPYPLIFTTVTGAHHYGFPSCDSDVDIRGAHLLPLRRLVGLHTGPETLDRTWTVDGMEVDLVTHDAEKFLRLLLSHSGSALEQLLSPLVLTTSDLHASLVALTPRLVTRHHAHHYRGFARTQRRLFAQNGQLKPLLYTWRALLTGVHLMRTGIVEAHLPTLLEIYPAPAYLPALITAKMSGEHSDLAALVTTMSGAPDQTRVNADLDSLDHQLDTAQAQTDLPTASDATDDLHHLLISARLEG